MLIHLSSFLASTLLFQDFFPFVNSSTFFFRFECQIMAFLYHYARFARAEKIDRNASSPMNGTGNKSKKGPDWQLVFLGGKKLLQVVSNVRFLGVPRGAHQKKNNGSIICFGSKTKGPSRDHLEVYLSLRFYSHSPNSKWWQAIQRKWINLDLSVCF